MEIQFKQEINAPAEKVWSVLAHKFAEISEWAPNIASSRVIEMSEVPANFKVADDAPVPGRVTPNPLGDVTEVLTEYSEEKKSFTFEIAGPAPLFSHTANTTKVVEQGTDKSIVTFDLQLSPKGIFNLFSPLLKRRFQTSKFGPAGMIRDLKNYVENNYWRE